MNRWYVLGSAPCGGSSGVGEARIVAGPLSLKGAEEEARLRRLRAEDVHFSVVEYDMYWRLVREPMIAHGIRAEWK